MSGVDLIIAERARQITDENWTAEHDDEHVSGELALVAALYATPVLLYCVETQYVNRITFIDPWPEGWDEGYDKRPHPGHGNVIGANEDLPSKKRIRQLVKAGAFIAAEIDRLLPAPAGMEEGT